MEALDIRNPKRIVFPTAKTISEHDSVRVKIRLILEQVGEQVYY